MLLLPSSIKQDKQAQATIIMMLLVTFLIIVWPLGGDGIVRSEGRDYLLSALSQSMAAIFGVVISVLFILTQLLNRYGEGIVDVVFDKKTGSLILIFALSIFLPLLFILFNFGDDWLRFSLIVGTVALISLVEFIRSSKERLKLTNRVDELYDQILEGKRKGQLYKSSKNLNALQSIGILATKESNLEVLKHTAERFGDLVEEAIKEPSNREELQNILEILLDVFYHAQDNIHHFKIVEKGLKRVIDTIQNNNLGKIEDFFKLLDALFKLLEGTITDGRVKQTRLLLHDYTDLIRISLEREYKGVYSTYLPLVASYSRDLLQYGLETCLDRLIGLLGDAGSETIEKNEKGVRYVIDQLESIGELLIETKRFDKISRVTIAFRHIEAGLPPLDFTSREESMNQYFEANRTNTIPCARGLIAIRLCHLTAMLAKKEGFSSEAFPKILSELKSRLIEPEINKKIEETAKEYYPESSEDIGTIFSRYLAG